MQQQIAIVLLLGILHATGTVPAQPTSREYAVLRALTRAVDSSRTADSVRLTKSAPGRVWENATRAHVIIIDPSVCERYPTMPACVHRATDSLAVSRWRAAAEALAEEGSMTNTPKWTTRPNFDLRAQFRPATDGRCRADLEVLQVSPTVLVDSLVRVQVGLYYRSSDESCVSQQGSGLGAARVRLEKGVAVVVDLLMAYLD